MTAALHPPAMPQKGQPSDDKGPKILAVLWGLTGFTMVVVAARMYIRGRMLRNFGADDWLIAFSMVNLSLSQS